MLLPLPVDTKDLNRDSSGTHKFWDETLCISQKCGVMLFVNSIISDLSLHQIPLAIFILLV